MKVMHALALRTGQLIAIPGIEGALKCLYVSEFSATVESLVDGRRYGLDCESAVDVFEEEDLKPKIQVPVVFEPATTQAILCEPVASALPQPDPNLPPIPVAA